jgi:hypothetical protein
VPRLSRWPGQPSQSFMTIARPAMTNVSIQPDQALALPAGNAHKFAGLMREVDSTAAGGRPGVFRYPRPRNTQTHGNIKRVHSMKSKHFAAAFALVGALSVASFVGAAQAQDGGGRSGPERAERAKYKQCRDTAKQEGLKGYKRFRAIEKCMK